MKRSTTIQAANENQPAASAVLLLAPVIDILARQAVRMANPEVLHASVQLREHEEASPNLPGVSAVIARPRAVTVRFLNENGEMEERDFVHLWATSAQHQVDHLNGKMYFDHLSPLKRKMLLTKADKLRKRG